MRERRGGGRPGAVVLLLCGLAGCGCAAAPAPVGGSAQLVLRFVAAEDGRATPCDWWLLPADGGEPVARGEATADTEVRVPAGRYRLEARALFGDGETAPLELEVGAGERWVRDVAVGPGTS